MSSLDPEIERMRFRLADLEEKKKIELEKKKNPKYALEKIVEEKKQYFEKTKLNNLGSSELRKHYFNQKDKLEFLEPIFEILKDFQKRLDDTEVSEPGENLF